MKQIIVISGPPGVGKSSLAKSIACELGFVILDKDDIDEAFSPGDRGQVYTKNIEPKVLNAMLRLAATNIEHNNVILDAPWTHILIDNSSLKDSLVDLCNNKGAELKVIELYLAENELYKRILNRNLVRDQNKLDPGGWKQFVKRDKITSRIPLDHFALDASLSLAKITKEALKYLKGSP